MSLAEGVIRELKNCGVRWVVWLPDSETRATYDLLSRDPDIRLVRVCREDEAVGICYGLLKGGERAAVMIQNTGLMNAVDAIRGIPIRMRQAMLLVVGYRGYRSLIESGENADNAAVLTEPLLQALRIPYFVVRHSGEVGQITEAFVEAERTSGPVVVLIADQSEVSR